MNIHTNTVTLEKSYLNKHKNRKFFNGCCKYGNRPGACFTKCITVSRGTTNSFVFIIASIGSNY